MSEVFDPWAGQSLGAVEKPPGFDAFWEEQQAIHRGEKEPSGLEHDTKGGSKGGSKGPKGGLKGKGKGRRRYNVPEPRASRARPTHFVAIRLFSRMIRRNVQQMQQWFIAKNPLFEQCLVPVRRLHSSLLLTSIPNDRRGEAQEACHEAGEEIRDMLGDQPVKIIASGISCFNGQILFTRLRTEPHDMLQAIHDALATSFMRNGFPVLDESAKSWLAEDEAPHDFKAHASFIKVSKALAHAKTDADKRRLRSLRVTCDDLDAWRDVFFGTQICTEFELLDMLGSSHDGYYPCLKLEHFHDRTIVVSEPSLDVSLTAGPVRTARLRVDPNAGAGMELSACAAGYLIESLQSWPGQPDLRPKDVIVAAGEALLLGLPEAEMESEFGSAFSNGALLVVGPLDLLLSERLEHVRRAAKRLLSPYQQEASGRSVASVSTVRSAAAMPRGRRFQLRAHAQEFRPDPLSAPGGDPWAAAAEQGHVYPQYSGWGTEFKKRKATVLDSGRFLRQAEHRAEPEPEIPLTKVHQRLGQDLCRASSEEQVVKILQRERRVLHVCNRILALSRLASLSGPKPPRLGDLLGDLQEDLETIEEAKSTLPPGQLASLALSLGRLGWGSPELFRCLGLVVRRVGLWSFGNGHCASLLEGFSRSRRCDEVLFQEASRLIMARASSGLASSALEPKQLATMVTAFACANISTETLFFFVGDLVCKQLKDLKPKLRDARWPLRLLAELADAFARVRARHPLLLDVVPDRLSECSFLKSGSIEALVLFFSAYVDARQGFGPEGLRERLVEALVHRKAELSTTLLRRLLQASARARWPNTSLLDVVPEIVQKDPSPWEVDAIYDCFLQLRVTPPASFPISEEKRQQREARLRARVERRERETQWRTPESVESQEAGSETSGICLRQCSLRVGEQGAGLVLECSRAGYLVDGCQDTPPQELQPGDVIVAISNSLLVDLSEDELEQRFGAEFRNQAPLLVAPFQELQKFSLERIRARAEELLGGSMGSAAQEADAKTASGPCLELDARQEDPETLVTAVPLGRTSPTPTTQGQGASVASTATASMASPATAALTQTSPAATSYYPRRDGRGRGSGARVWRPKHPAG